MKEKEIWLLSALGRRHSGPRLFDNTFGDMIETQ